jgi:hypothetical protein
MNGCAVWLYGSRARGDSQVDSDFDVIVVGSISDYEVSHILRIESGQLSISRYSWEEIEGMASYGSLFLHHLHYEGRPIFEAETATGKLAGLLSHLPPYSRARKDLCSFRQTVDDVRYSIKNGGSTKYELSVLGTVLRHSAILACYLLGKPSFGRHEPVLTAIEEFRLGHDVYEWFVQLYKFRLYVDGRVFDVPVSSKSVFEWCAIIELFLSKMEAIVDNPR